MALSVETLKMCGVTEALQNVTDTWLVALQNVTERYRMAIWRYRTLQNGHITLQNVTGRQHETLQKRYRTLQRFMYDFIL